LRVTSTAEALLELARLALALGRTERITRHPTGEFESVATHQNMLAWCAVSLAGLWPEWLDLGEVAMAALVHDAPECICGDTATLRISAEDRAAKAEREEAALAEIDRRLSFTTAPWALWLPHSVSVYESAKNGEWPASEAIRSFGLKRVVAIRFVRAVDKFMPKLTHLLNGGVTLRESGICRAELQELLDRQREDLLATLPEQVADGLSDIQRELSEMTLALPLENGGMR
jgi:hypothetical protein